VRLYLRGRRDEAVAERLLAGAFFFIGVSSVVYAAATFPYYASIELPLVFSGRLLFSPVPVLVAMFTRRVFRERDDWAKWLVRVCPILLAVGVGGSILFRGDWAGFSAGSPWFWTEWAGFCFPFAWASVEAFLLYAKARRRVPLGLCDPLVCNRFLLWGLFGALQVCAFMTLFPMYADYSTGNGFAALWDAAYSVLLVGSLVMIGLAFLAPAFYKRWISGSASVAKSVEV
jgi:hypothetical protein